MFPKLGMEVPSQEGRFIVVGNVNTKFLSMISMFTISNTLFYSPFCSHKWLLKDIQFQLKPNQKGIPTSILSIVFIFKSYRCSS